MMTKEEKKVFNAEKKAWFRGFVKEKIQEMDEEQVRQLVIKLNDDEESPLCDALPRWYEMGDFDNILFDEYYPLAIIEMTRKCTKFNTEHEFGALDPNKEDSILSTDSIKATLSERTINKIADYLYGIEDYEYPSLEYEFHNNDAVIYQNKMLLIADEGGVYDFRSIEELVVLTDGKETIEVLLKDIYPMQ